MPLAMRKITAVTIGPSAFCSTSNAQMAEKVDLVLGNYVPVPDAFFRDDPDPTKPNFYLIGSSQPQRNARTTAPASSASPIN